MVRLTSSLPPSCQTTRNWFFHITNSYTLPLGSEDMQCTNTPKNNPPQKKKKKLDCDRMQGNLEGSGKFFCVCVSFGVNYATLSNAKLPSVLLQLGPVPARV